MIRSYSDYYPFGSIMPGRNASSGDYRYGFNGKERDSEVSGEGNSYDYGFRMYDSRLGRFTKVDPLTHLFPHLTPYQYAGNYPIAAIDVDGLEPTLVIDDAGKLTKPMVKILVYLTGVDENLLFDATITNGKLLQGLSALTVGNEIKFSTKALAINDNSNPNHINFWIEFMSHEAMHLPQAAAFGIDKRGRRSFVLRSLKQMIVMFGHDNSQFEIAASAWDFTDKKTGFGGIGEILTNKLNNQLFGILSNPSNQPEEIVLKEIDAFFQQKKVQNLIKEKLTSFQEKNSKAISFSNKTFDKAQQRKVNRKARKQQRERRRNGSAARFD